MKKKMYGAKSSARVVPRNARKSRKLREAMEMGRGYAIRFALFSFVLAAGCKGTPEYAFGEDATARIVAQLKFDTAAAAALDTRDASYLLRGSDLVAERTALFAALARSIAAKDLGVREAHVTEGQRQAIERYAGGDRGLAAVTLPQFYEEERSSGTLYIARHEVPGQGPRGSYEVSFRKAVTGDFVIVERTPELDRAWSRLVQAARGATVAYTTEMPSEPRAGHPLARLRDVEKERW